MTRALGSEEVKWMLSNLIRSAEFSDVDFKLKVCEKRGPSRGQLGLEWGGRGGEGSEEVKWVLCRLSSSEQSDVDFKWKV